jgi:hypothetical protein
MGQVSVPLAQLLNVGLFGKRLIDIGEGAAGSDWKYKDLV